MFLICTAENSVLWEKLCKSVSLHTVSSIDTVDSTKDFNIVQKPLTQVDLTPSLTGDANITTILVTTPPELQLASAFKSSGAFDVEYVIENLSATLALAANNAFEKVCSIEVFFKDINKCEPLNSLAHYFSRVSDFEFSPKETSIAKLIVDMESRIKPLYKQIEDLLSSGVPSTCDLAQSVTNSGNELIEAMRMLNQYFEENKVLLEQLTQIQLNVAENVKAQREKELSLEQDISVLMSQLFILQNQLEVDGVGTSKENAKLVSALTAKNKELALENSKLTAKLKRKSEAEKQLRLQVAELRAIEQSVSWKISKKFEKLSTKVSKNAKQRNRLLENVAIIYSSDYFDADWYLSTYKDVKESGVDPAEHYLVFGAKEGRLPSLEFDGDWYLQKNLDVAESGMNPLLHFLKFGKSEKRSPSRF